MKHKPFYVVIHTEEEFNWNEGFFKDNVEVTHATQLKQFVIDAVHSGAKVVLAIDFAFANSESGACVLKALSEGYATNIEFASHLQPWNSPPFPDNNNRVEDKFSFPGNLSYELEFKKLEALTEKVKSVTGFTPVTYLAGRYGLGENTHKILSVLGYKYDISVSPFSDFSHQFGPDYSLVDNSVKAKNNVTCIPHSAGFISYITIVSKYFMKHPSVYKILNASILGKLILKVLGVRWVRLSTEGFSVEMLLKLTKTLEAINASQLLFSFHSPSLKAGLTPYVRSEVEAEAFKTDTLQLIKILHDDGYKSTRFIELENGNPL